MNTLPNEIWNRIFTQLKLKERLNCMLVCRNWRTLIDEYSLLCEIKIEDNVDLFRRFMDMVKRSPYRAAQVKKLKFRNSVDFDFDQRTLCNTFYNTRLFEITHEHQNFDSFHRFNGPVDMTRSKTKVEVPLDYFHCDLTLQLLTSDLCGALRTLELDFPGSENDTSGQTIVAQMIDLPVLEELSLLGLNLRIDELDTLHQNVPSIQTFTIDFFCVLDSQAPDDIAPAVSLTNLTIDIDMVDTLETHVELYKYMTRIYININGTEGTATDFRDKSLLIYGSDTVAQLYSGVIHDFMQFLGPATTTMSYYNVPDQTNVFKTLDDAEARICVMSFHDCENLHLLEDLSSSHQRKYVNSLLFDSTIIHSPRFLQNMTTLNALHLVHFDTVDLSTYLNVLPETVKTFAVNCRILDVDIKNTRITCIPNIIIRCIFPSDDLGRLLSENFLKLESLNLAVPISNYINITLHKGRPLQHVYFTTLRIEEGHGFVFNQLEQTNYYLCNDETTLATMEAIKDLPLLTFTTPHKFKLDICDDVIILSR